ncbi:MAG: gliding motility-associated C-terminal domain-containing protein, partial [Chitinophagales bacterium]
CTASDAVVVTQNTTPPNANAGADQAISCTTATAILSGSSSTPGVSFAWSGPGIVSGGSTATPTINVVGTYTLTVTDLLNGCTASDVVDITPNVNTPDINAGPDQLLTCAITSVNLTATSLTPGVTFAWSNGAPTASTAVSTPNTYYVTATNTINGCLAVDQVDVLQDITPPTVNAGNDGTLTCTVTSISLTATSNAVGAGFAWSNGVNTATNKVTLPNTYTVTATSPTNGCTASDAVVVTQNITPPTINAGADALLTCVVTSINLSATSTVSGATFAWSNGINVSANTVTTPNTYAVTATDPTNGCTAADAVDVTQNTVAPNVSAGLDQVLTCVNTSATLSGSSTTAGVNFAWSGPGTINNGTSAAATVNTAGTFTLLVTDPVNGCTASDNVNVTTNVNAPNVNAGPDQLLTCAVTTVTLNGSSSTPGATFAWSDGATTPSTSTSYPNTYSLTVTDAVNGCQSVDQVVVNQNITPPSVNAGVDTKLTCLITSVTLTASSGASGASFAWSDGATSSSTVVSSPNTYTVTATDPANGCTASDDVIVNIDGEPSMTIAIKDNPCPDVAKGFVIPSVTGGILPYHYNWSNGSTASGLTGLHGGQYDLTVTDGNGCTLTQSSTIVEGGSLSITNLTSVEINLGESIQLNPVVNGTSAPISYTWTPPIYLSCSDCSNPIVNTVASIKYTLSVIDTNGCKAHDTVKITVIPDYQIYVPNAFTPNGDGFNDIFEIYGKKNLWKEMSMIIYNRWGEKVFDTNDSQFGWDGTFHGVLQNPQVYVYELRITFINGYAMPLQKGSITLIR